MDAAEHIVLGRFLWSNVDRSALSHLGGAVACAGLAALCAVGGPVALKFLIDTLGRTPGAGAGLVLAGVYVASLGAQRAAEQAQAYAFGVGEQRLQQRVSAAIFAHVLRLPMAFHLERQTGALMQTLTLGLQGLRILLTHASFSVLPVAVQGVLIALVVGAIFDGWMWATTASAMALYAWVFAIGVKRLSAPTRAVSSALIEASAVFADGILNIEPIKAFSGERDMGARYQGLLGKAEQRWRVFHARRLENGLATALVFVASLGAVMAQGAFALAAGRISVGDFVLLNAFMLQIIRPLEMAGFALRDMAQAVHYLEKWRDLLVMKPETVGAGRLGRPARHAPSIRFEHVSFAYDERAPALKDVCFTIEAGRTLAVVGASGAGKSSLVRLLMRYYEPDAGRIWIDGEPIDGVDLDRLRAMIALVSQDTVLFNASLEHNIRFARPDADKDALADAVRKAQLEELAARLPEGLAAQVGERGLKLSGGEKQRVAIARAALKAAPILVLDEATSALDAATEQAVCTALGEAMSGRTCLIVTHRLALARRADEIVVLDAGEVRERGGHDHLAAAGGLYARLWRAQQQDAPSAAFGV